jgi:integrase/recombinase XerD
LGIKARNGSGAPTLHSFRHTFVVTRLRRWHEEGVDVKTRLDHLATYLGHVDFGETFWYVTATPELLTSATAEFAAPSSAGGE